MGIGDTYFDLHILFLTFIVSIRVFFTKFAEYLGYPIIYGYSGNIQTLNIILNSKFSIIYHEPLSL